MRSRLWKNKATSLLLLRLKKVSSTKDNKLDRQTCKGILFCLHLVTSKVSLYASISACFSLPFSLFFFLPVFFQFRAFGLFIY